MGETNDSQVNAAAAKILHRTHAEDTTKGAGNGVPGNNDPMGGVESGVISRNAPRQLNPMGKALAVVLSVLLVVTCWNTYALEEARDMIVGDAVP